MKTDKISLLPWSVLLVVLLAITGAISIGLTSAAPVSAALDQTPAEGTPESIESIPTSQPESMEESVELAKRRMINPNIYRWIMLTRTKKRDLSSSTITPEEELEFESEESVDLFKRQMRKSGQIQTVHPDDYLERDLSSVILEEEESEEESEDYVALSKRRMMIDKPYGTMLYLEEE
ncbi:MAG: hypothetical protein JOS17DRAFT_785898 [Linnemannia elongata]|nr:MAG: hypothetical protein JOS17DRAFT_785898 [Linnemannia elongata]